MSNLIITVVAITLVAVLVAATAFFAGEAMLSGRNRAEAGRLSNEAQTLLSAVVQLQYHTFAAYPPPRSEAPDPDAWPPTAREFFDQRAARGEDYVRGRPPGGAFNRRRPAGEANPAWSITDRFLFTPLGENEDSGLGEDTLDICQRLRADAGFPDAYGDGAPEEPLSCGVSQADVDAQAQRNFEVQGARTDIGSTVAHPADPCCVCDETATNHELCQE